MVCCVFLFSDVFTETWEYQLWKEVKLSNQKNGIMSCLDLVHKVKVFLSFFYVYLNYNFVIKDLMDNQ